MIEQGIERISSINIIINKYPDVTVPVKPDQALECDCKMFVFCILTNSSCGQFGFHSRLENNHYCVAAFFFFLLHLFMGVCNMFSAQKLLRHYYLHVFPLYFYQSGLAACRRAVGRVSQFVIWLQLSKQKQNVHSRL